VHPIKSVSSVTSIEYFKALVKGTAPRAPMLELFDINFDSAEPGPSCSRRRRRQNTTVRWDLCTGVMRPFYSIPVWPQPS
jgi:hypothetical protein